MRELRPTVRGSAARVLAGLACGLLAASTASAQAPTSPSLALGRLKAGNDRFVTSASAPVALGVSTREALVKGQTPFAMVLSCADARVPPEFVFNTGLGDLFVVRSLAGVPDKSMIATLEHGATALHVPLLVVMGHESCETVAAAVSAETAHGANRQQLIAAIRAGTDRLPAERKDLRSAVLATVEQVINDVMAASEPLRLAASTGRLQVVGAYYELASGRVVFSEPVTAGAATTHK